MPVKQKIGLKRLKKVAAILGRPLKVGFVNGGLPHNVVLAWDANGDAYFVNMKRKTVRQYLKGKKLLMHKLVDWRDIKMVKLGTGDTIDPVTLDLPSREWLLNKYGLDEFQVKQLDDDDLKLLLDEWDAEKKAQRDEIIEEEWRAFQMDKMRPTNVSEFKPEYRDMMTFDGSWSEMT